MTGISGVVCCPHDRCGWNYVGTDTEAERSLGVHLGLMHATVDPRQRVQPKRGGWTPTEVVAAIQAFAREHGRPPKSAEWFLCADGRPTTTIVKRRFGSWASGIEAAGFPRPIHGRRYA